MARKIFQSMRDSASPFYKPDLEQIVGALGEAKPKPTPKPTPKPAAKPTPKPAAKQTPKAKGKNAESKLSAADKLKQQLDALRGAADDEDEEEPEEEGDEKGDE